MSISQHILAPYVWDVIYEGGYIIYSQRGTNLVICQCFSYLDLKNQKKGLNYHVNNIVHLYPTFTSKNLEHFRTIISFIPKEAQCMWKRINIVIPIFVIRNWTLGFLEFCTEPVSENSAVIQDCTANFPWVGKFLLANSVGPHG